MRRRSKAGSERAKSRRGKTMTQKRRGLRDPSATDRKAQSDIAQITRERDEALEQQTATAEVLNVISQSPSELQPVLDKIVEIAAHLCQADYSFIWKLDDGIFHLASINNVEADFAKFAREHPHSPNPGTVSGRAVLEKRTVHIPDVLEDSGYDWHEGQSIGHYRTLLGVPLLREGAPLGAFVLMRKTVRPFTEKQIKLVTGFADQAVIAIENVRLFEAEQQRSRELSEALEYQTATGEVLNVISRSPSNVQPVFDMIAESAWRLCHAQFCFVYQFDGQLLHFIAHHGLTPELVEINRRNYPAVPSRTKNAGPRF